MKATVEYTDLNPQQKLRAFWHDFCDSDPTPPEFCDEMEAAGYIELVRVRGEHLEQSFASERGIEKGGLVWELTSIGRRALAGEGKDV